MADDSLIKIDEIADVLVDAFRVLAEEIDKIEPSSVPQRAAKDRMKEIVERAFEPYLEEIIVSSSVFEQGTE